MRKIQILRGTFAKKPNLEDGQMYLAKDTKQVFVGDKAIAEGEIEFANKSDLTALTDEVNTQATDIEFNPHRDFVSLGFKMINTDNIYIGASEWIYDETATQIMAHGIISVENPNNIYALYNVGNYTIFLNTPDLNDINSNSYFTNSLITIIIEYLGKQEI